MKRKLSVVVLICIVVLCLGACGKSSSPATQSISSDQTGGQTQQETQSAASDSATGLDSALVGNWQEAVFDSGFIFNADGTGTDTFWELTFTYETSGGEVLIIYDSDTYGASKYTYSVSGDSLTMTRIDEEETSTFTYTKTSVSETTTASSDTDASAEGESDGEGEADSEETGN